MMGKVQTDTGPGRQVPLKTSSAVPNLTTRWQHAGRPVPLRGSGGDLGLIVDVSRVSVFFWVGCGSGPGGQFLSFLLWNHDL